MKPPQFEYLRPDSVGEAVAALNEFGESARILAGGQSLIPMMNFRIAQPSHLIDITRIPGLDVIVEEQGFIKIGASARQSAVEGSDLVKERCPLLVDALKLVAHEPIRHRGTVCGSLAHADPHSELAALALALKAEFTVLSAEGERTVPALDFFQGPFTTVVDSAEMLTHVRFPVMAATSGYAIEEFSRTHGNFAIAGAVSVVDMASDGTVGEVTLSLFGLASRPIRALAAETRLRGVLPTTEAIAEAADVALEDVDCSADMHGSAEYRANIGRVYARRVLTSAIARAQGGTK
jgi:carbon-monoxide dehydrogenase medium subunit